MGPNDPERAVPRARQPGAPWDLLAILIALVGVIVAVLVSGLADRLRRWLEEASWGDEAVLGLALLAGALAVLAGRRWRALLREGRIRRLAEKALAESERRYRSLVEASPDAIVVHRDGRFVYANQAAADLLGAPSPDHLLHKPVLEIVHPDYRALVAERLTAEQHRGEAVPLIEEKLVTLDGRVIDVEVAGIPFAWEGKPAGQTIIRDVTQRREAERELQAAEERFRALVEQVPAITYTWEAPIRPGAVPAPYVSPQIEAMLGFTVEEWLADPRRWHDQVHPDDREPTLAEWSRCAEAGAPFRAEYRMFARDGREIWILDEAAMVSRRPDGRPGLYQGVMLDITERKHAEQALAEAEARYRGLVEQVPVVVYIDAVDDLSTATYVSPRYEDLLGYTSEERLAQPDLWVRILHPEDRDRVVAESRRTNETGEPFRAEYRLLHRDGHTVWVRDEAILLRDADDEPLAWQGVLFDITEQKQSDDRLLRRDAILEAVAFAAETFLGTGSWEERIDGVLEKLGHATQSSRVYVYENEVGEEGETLASERCEWTAPGIVPTIGSDINQRFPYRAGGFGRWEETLSRGGSISGAVAEFPEPERELIKDDSIRSMAAVPIFVDGQWWGYLGLDDCDLQRPWSPAEIDALRAAAGTLGAAIGRRRALARIEEGERRYRGLVEQLPAVTYMVTDTGERRYVSPQIEDLLGYAPGEWLSEPARWRNTIHPDDRERVLALDAAAGPDVPFNCEYRLIRKDGRPVWVQDHAVLLRTRPDEPGVWQGILLDVSERKRAEEQLARRDQLLQSVSEAAERFLEADWQEVMPEVLQRLGEATEVSRVYVFEAGTAEDGARVTRQSFEWARPGIASQTGEPTMEEFRADELGFGPWIDRLAAGETVEGVVAEMDEPVRRLLASQEIRSIVQVPVFAGPRWWGLIGFDDCEHERRWTPTEIDALRTAAGVLGAAIGRRDVDRMRHRAEERYRALVEHIPAVLYIDRADEDMTGVYVSPQVEPLLGVSAEDYLHHPELWDRSIHPDDYDGLVREVREGVRSDRPWASEYRWIRPDGRIVWIRDEAVVLHDEEGRPEYVQGVMFDITERRLAEEALARNERREREAADRLRALDEMKNTFLAAVSHELRSPLTSILGLALTLERQEVADEDRADLVERLAANARKLDRLLQDLLDIDRLNRGIVAPQYRVVDVGALARRTVESTEQLRDRSVRVATEEVRVPVDPAKVERIVENLVANAVRHTSDRTSIWVRVEPRDGGVLLAVEDDGPGVPPELRHDIFEPFRQGPSSTPHSPGTGIGLSLVARFAELHGGRAWVEAREGGGASFRVFLPGTRPASTGLPAAGVRSGGRGLD